MEEGGCKFHCHLKLLNGIAIYEIAFMALCINVEVMVSPECGRFQRRACLPPYLLSLYSGFHCFDSDQLSFPLFWSVLQEVEAAKSWPCWSGRIPKTLRFDPWTSQTSGLFVAKFTKLAS